VEAYILAPYINAIGISTRGDHGVLLPRWEPLEKKGLLDALLVKLPGSDSKITKVGAFVQASGSSPISKIEYGITREPTEI